MIIVISGKEKNITLGPPRTNNNEIYADMMIKFYVCPKETVADVVIYILPRPYTALRQR